MTPAIHPVTESSTFSVVSRRVNILMWTCGWKFPFYQLLQIARMKHMGKFFWLNEWRVDFIFIIHIEESNRGHTNLDSNYQLYFK